MGGGGERPPHSHWKWVMSNRGEPQMLSVSSGVLGIPIHTFTHTHCESRGWLHDWERGKTHTDTHHNDVCVAYHPDNARLKRLTLENKRTFWEKVKQYLTLLSDICLIGMMKKHQQCYFACKTLNKINSPKIWNNPRSDILSNTECDGLWQSVAKNPLNVLYVVI